MLIPPPYPNPISLVCPHGNLAIPDLPWSRSISPLTATSSSMGSFRGMFTNVQKYGHQSTLTRYLPHIQTSASLTPNDTQILENSILSDIQQVLAAGSHYHGNPLLQHIAVGIHLWGGRAGRQAFSRKGGFAVSCPPSSYASLLHQLLTHPAGTAPPGGNWPKIMALTGNFSNIGVAFLTKHLAFWSRAAGSPIELPVLDSMIFNKFLSPIGSPTWKHYAMYAAQIDAHRASISLRPGLSGVTVSSIERDLFNWIKSPGASNWIR